MISTRCPYCNNNFVATTVLSDTRAPDRMIPFKQTKEQAIEAFKAASKGLPFLPKRFRDSYTVSEIRGVYVPFWLYDAGVDADVSFQTTRVTTWSDSDTDYTRTDTYNVYRSGSMSFVDIPVSGTSQIDAETTEGVEPFDYLTSTQFATAYLTDFVTNRYDVEPEEANGRAAQRLERTAIDALKDTVTGFSTVSTSNADIRVQAGEVEYVFLPIWLLNIEYGSKLYRFAMNGQSGKLVGEFPISRAKRIATGIVMSIASFLLVYVGASFLFALLSQAIT